MAEDIEALSAGWQLFTLSERNNVPLSMTVELTRRCHLHCVHCYLNETQEANIPDKLKKMRERELSAGEWREAFGQMADAGCMYLVLTGGEVFLRPDFLEIARSARGLAYNVRVFTTAMHVDERSAGELAEMGVERVEVSLYGGRATHAKVTGCEAAFDRSMRGVRLLRRAGLPVSFKVPLMTVNVEERHELLDLAGEHGVLCKFDPTVVPRNDGSKDNLDLRLPVEKLNEVFADPRMTSHENLENAAAFQSGDYEDFLCSAGRNAGGMDPYGNVFPCMQWELPCGNVRETPFQEIWRDSPVLKAVRRMRLAPKRKDGGVGSGTDGYCNNCPGLAQLENGDPLRPSIFDKMMQNGAYRALTRIHEREKEEETV